jgi:hypothetical protein
MNIRAHVAVVVLMIAAAAGSRSAPAVVGRPLYGPPRS